MTFFFSMRPTAYEYICLPEARKHYWLIIVLFIDGIPIFFSCYFC